MQLARNAHSLGDAKPPLCLNHANHQSRLVGDDVGVSGRNRSVLEQRHPTSGGPFTQRRKLGVTNDFLGLCDSVNVGNDDSLCTTVEGS